MVKIFVMNMFVLIHPGNMVIGTKYKIENYEGILVKKPSLDDFEEDIDLEDFEGFAKLMFEFENKRLGPRYYFPGYYDFYQYVSQNPQWKMERRAVNLIVRRLLGDPCFEW